MTLVDIKDEIISGLATLAPKVDPNKASLEMDPVSIEISNFLADPAGLELVEFMGEILDEGKSSILIPNKFPERKELERLIQSAYSQNSKKNLRILLEIFYFFWEKYPDIDPRILFQSLKKVERSSAIFLKKSTLKICCDCKSDNPEVSKNTCCNENAQNILEIVEGFFHEKVKQTLQYNQYLEIYIKNCLVASGIGTIGWGKESYGKNICTSSIYRVDGEPVEIDLIGISTPFTVLLIEVKTSKNITMTEIRKTENKFEGIIKKINKFTNRELPFLKIFITTGKFDPNLSIDGYKRKSWDFINRVKIMRINDELKRLIESI
ncbi:MAG: hypothetical protein WC382_08055 [Methanoregulaceae archaeon]|jgi:hypothetical protein